MIKVLGLKQFIFGLLATMFVKRNVPKRGSFQSCSESIKYPC